MGINALRRGKTKITIMLPQPMIDRIVAVTQISKRGLSGEIEYALEQYLNEFEREHGLTSPKTPGK